VSTLLIIVLAILLYFLPYFIARYRHHHNTNSILVLNLFLGWSLIGWVIALAMAVSHIPQPA
jgi:RsiW-degrading membrane proteinase PrsW (M82 family)